VPSLTEERGLILSTFTVHDKWRAVGVSKIPLPLGISSCVFTYRVILNDVCLSSIASFISANVGRTLSAHNMNFVILMDENCSYTQANNILRKTPTNALILLITLYSHFYTSSCFSPHPQGRLIHFVSRCKYQIKERCIV
jgi:hypothetical protein